MKGQVETTEWKCSYIAVGVYVARIVHTVYYCFEYS